jgi:uncharacterized phage protein (TIGR02218 family)
MSYDSIEQSVESGSVVELYEFTQGVSKHLYCSTESSIVYQSRTYKPFSGSRKTIKQTTDVLKDSISFTFPRADEFASQYLGFAPDDLVTVSIYRGHTTDSSGMFVVYWKGRVIGSKTSGNEISIDCESVFTSIKRPGLRARFEYNCRHSLYLPSCGVNKESYKVQRNIISISGVSIDIQGGSALGSGYLTGGMLVTNLGISRFITSHVNDNIKIARPINGLTGGTLVSLYPGCDHSIGVCQSKFNNVDNFGGFPWVPAQNPFAGSSIV